MATCPPEDQVPYAYFEDSDCAKYIVVGGKKVYLSRLQHRAGDEKYVLCHAVSKHHSQVMTRDDTAAKRSAESKVLQGFLLKFEDKLDNHMLMDILRRSLDCRSVIGVRAACKRITLNEATIFTWMMEDDGLYRSTCSEQIDLVFFVAKTCRCAKMARLLLRACLTTSMIPNDQLVRHEDVSFLLASTLALYLQPPLTQNTYEVCKFLKEAMALVIAHCSEKVVGVPWAKYLISHISDTKMAKQLIDAVAEFDCTEDGRIQEIQTLASALNTVLCISDESYGVCALRNGVVDTVEWRAERMSWLAPALLDLLRTRVECCQLYFSTPRSNYLEQYKKVAEAVCAAYHSASEGPGTNLAMQLSCIRIAKSMICRLVNYEPDGYKDILHVFSHHSHSSTKVFLHEIILSFTEDHRSELGLVINLPSFVSVFGSTVIQAFKNGMGGTSFDAYSYIYDIGAFFLTKVSEEEGVHTQQIQSTYTMISWFLQGKAVDKETPQATNGQYLFAAWRAGIDLLELLASAEHLDIARRLMVEATVEMAFRFESLNCAVTNMGLNVAVAFQEEVKEKIRLLAPPLPHFRVWAYPLAQMAAEISCEYLCEMLMLPPYELSVDEFLKHENDPKRDFVSRVNMSVYGPAGPFVQQKKRKYDGECVKDSKVRRTKSI